MANSGRESRALSVCLTVRYELVSEYACSRQYTRGNRGFAMDLLTPALPVSPIDYCDLYSLSSKWDFSI